MGVGPEPEVPGLAFAAGWFLVLAAEAGSRLKGLPSSGHSCSAGGRTSTDWQTFKGTVGVV